MSSRNSWAILTIAVAAGLLALRLNIPDAHQAQQPQSMKSNDPAALPPTIESRRPPLPLMRQPSVTQSVPESQNEDAAIAQPATDMPSTPSHKPAAKHFADVTLPDKDQTPAQEIARIALSFVGVDEDAEDVWMAAINDPSMPAEDRKNLIEDLNEDGFGDPDHPTADELPLIVNRLDLIESIAADAIDDVNLAAFAEAHKDLLAMYNRLTQ